MVCQLFWVIKNVNYKCQTKCFLDGNIRHLAQTDITNINIATSARAFPRWPFDDFLKNANKLLIFSFSFRTRSHISSSRNETVSVPWWTVHSWCKKLRVTNYKRWGFWKSWWRLQKHWSDPCIVNYIRGIKQPLRLNNATLPPAFQYILVLVIVWFRVIIFSRLDEENLAA